MEQPIPVLDPFVLKRSITERTPFPVKHRTAIVTAKIGPERFLKASAEDHRRPGLFCTPAVQITMTVATRAAKVVGDLGVAKDHLGYSPSRPGCSLCRRAFPTLPP